MKGFLSFCLILSLFVLSLSLSVPFCLLICAFFCLFPSLYFSSYVSLSLSVSPCFVCLCLYFSVFLCLYLSLSITVFLCLSLFLYISLCLCLAIYISLSFKIDDIYIIVTDYVDKFIDKKNQLIIKNCLFRLNPVDKELKSSVPDR